MSLHIDIKKKLAAFTLEVALDADDETLGFLGESGCGKSMTLRCIAGIERPDEGVIQVNGTTYFDSAARICLSPQQRKTALLFQNYMLFPHMTVEANIAAGIDDAIAKSERRAIIAREVERFGLKGFEKRFPLQLSGGQQQRVALARMLAARPGILMLDEPFSALDAHLKDVLQQNLFSLFEAFSGTILYVSHDIDEAVRLCDRIAVVEAGQVMEVAEPDTLINRPQSEAGMKLSGVKNVTEVVRTGSHHVHAPRWGVDIGLSCDVPEDIKYIGIRGFYLEQAAGPGPNTYRMRCDGVTDARFDRSVMLQFLDRSADAEPLVTADENEMKYLHQHLVWRVDKLKVKPEDLPQTGDEVWIRFPEDRLYAVCR